MYACFAVIFKNEIEKIRKILHQGKVADVEKLSKIIYKNHVKRQVCIAKT